MLSIHKIFKKYELVCLLCCGFQCIKLEAIPDCCGVATKKVPLTSIWYLGDLIWLKQHIKHVYLWVLKVSSSDHINPYLTMIPKLRYHTLQRWSQWLVSCKPTSWGIYSLGLFICLYSQIYLYEKTGVLCAAVTHFKSSLESS